MAPPPVPHDPRADRADPEGWRLELRPGVGVCLAGDLQRISLDGILDIVTRDRITGSLRVRAASVERCVLFCRGEARQASSSLPHERFGAIAVGMGILKQEQVRELLSYDHDAPIGRLAVDWGLLSDHNLWRVMQEHIVTILQGMMSQGRGLFALEHSTADPPAAFPGFATKGLVREATDRAEELERLRAEIPQGSSLELVGEVRHALPRQEGALAHELMEGRLSVAELCSRLHCPELSVMKAVARLVGAGLVRVASTERHAPDEDHEILTCTLLPYNRVFREIREVCERAGAGDALARATEASLQEEPVLSELLEGIRLLPDGTLPQDKVLARCKEPRLSVEEQRAALLRDLIKLAKFQLFFAGERLDPLVHESLYERVKRALRPV